LKINRKSKFRTALQYTLGLCVFLFLLALSCFLLITHRPSGYVPTEQIKDKQVSSYLTHELAADFYNNLHRGEPFDLVVSQNGINDIIAHSGWPRQINNLLFSEPAVVFVPGKILLMGTVAVNDIDVIVTIVLRPEINDSGRLRLEVAGIRAGALNITVLAKNFVGRAFNQAKIKENEPVEAILSAILMDESLETVLEIEGTKVRIENIGVSRGKLTVRFAPAG